MLASSFGTNEVVGRNEAALARISWQDERSRASVSRFAALGLLPVAQRTAPHVTHMNLDVDITVGTHVM
jgi:hypothetical protein